MRDLIHALGLAAMLATLPESVLAQDISWAAGTWKGRLEGYPGQDSDRVMIVDVAGGKTTCRWGEGFRAKPGPAPSCTVTATDLKLTTGAKNPVELRRDGNALKGTWTNAASGKSYRLAMAKE